MRRSFHKSGEIFFIFTGEDDPTPLDLQPHPKISSLSDQEIICQYKHSSDHDLVGELFRRYTRFVFLVCIKYLKDEELSKDATMQIFESLFGSLKKHDIRNFKPWLHQVSKNHCLLQLRNKKDFKPLESENGKELPLFVESDQFSYLTVEKEENLVKLEEAIQCLSTDQRECIELFYLKKKSYGEVAETTGFSYKQVKSNIQNGKRNLRLILDTTHG